LIGVTPKIVQTLLILRTSSGLASLYIFDGTGNPAAFVTSGANTAFAYTYGLWDEFRTGCYLIV